MGFMCRLVDIRSHPALAQIQLVPRDVSDPFSILTLPSACHIFSWLAAHSIYLCIISLDSQLNCIYSAAEMAATTAIKQQRLKHTRSASRQGVLSDAKEHCSVVHPFQKQAQYGPVLVICKIELLALVLARRQPLQMMKECHLGRVFGTVHLPLD